MRKCRFKNIGVVAVVVPELKFSDVQRQVFGAYLVIGADNTTLQDRPEALNRIRVDRPDNVLLRSVADHGMIIVIRPQMFEIRSIVGHQRRNTLINRAMHKAVDGAVIHARNHAGDEITLAAHSADYSGLARTSAASTAAALVPMLVAVFAANIRLIHLYDATKAFFGLHKAHANAVAHVPSGFVRAEAHVAVNLPRAYSLFAGKHQVSDFEPIPQRRIRVLKNGARIDRETVALRRAFTALPMKLFVRRCIVQVAVIAARAFHAIRPTALYQVGFARGFIGKHRVKLLLGHLGNGTGLFSAGHEGISYAS